MDIEANSLKGSFMARQFITGSTPPRYPAGCAIPTVNDAQLRGVYDSIDPDVLGEVIYVGLRESLDNRQVIIYRNFRGEISGQFLDVLLTDNSPEHHPIENSIRSIFVHELSEPSDPVEFASETVQNIETEFPDIQWFGETDQVRIDGQ